MRKSVCPRLCHATASMRTSPRRPAPRTVASSKVSASSYRARARCTRRAEVAPDPQRRDARSRAARTRTARGEARPRAVPCVPVTPGTHGDGALHNGTGGGLEIRASRPTAKAALEQRLGLVVRPALRHPRRPRGTGHITAAARLSAARRPAARPPSAPRGARRARGRSKSVWTAWPSRSSARNQRALRRRRAAESACLRVGAPARRGDPASRRRGPGPDAAHLRRPRRRHDTPRRPRARGWPGPWQPGRDRCARGSDPSACGDVARRRLGLARREIEVFGHLPARHRRLARSQVGSARVCPIRRSSGVSIAQAASRTVACANRQRPEACASMQLRLGAARASAAPSVAPGAVRRAPRAAPHP
jgi:hypothetical protein